MSRIAFTAFAALAALACSSTTDSLGTNEARAPVSPRNLFHELLGKETEEIDSKVNDAFEQLFHGDPETEAIYYEVGTSQAYILNTGTAEIRTDAVGYGLLITLELDKPDEFDRIWRYARANLRYRDGPREGYLYWDCPEGGGCPDPNGMQYVALALLFAEARWGTARYGDDAMDLLEVMIHREDINGGIIDGVHDVFDEETNVVRTTPMADDNRSTTSFVLPAFTTVFIQRSVDPLDWQRITRAAREVIVTFTATPTGLPPNQMNFMGEPTTERFGDEAYRVGMNLAVDHLWHDVDWAPQANPILEFFAAEGGSYGAEYDIDTGEVLDGELSYALVATNGATAAAATTDERVPFVQAVWDMPIPTGSDRYYSGVLYLMSLLILSDKLQVH